MKPLYVFCISLLITSLLHAQIPPFAWAGNFGGAESIAIDVDNSGNVYTTGTFTNTVDFDPDPDTHADIDLYGSYSDAYVSKLDVNGNYVWAKHIGGINDHELGLAIKVNSVHEVYVAGTFEGTTDLDPGPGTYEAISVGETDLFLVKLDADGNLLWAFTLGDEELDYTPVLAMDAADNIYFSGSYRGTVDFDPGPGTVSMSSDGYSNDVFIAKYSDAGTLNWVKTFEGGQMEYPMGIDIDASGNIITVGSLFGTVDFDPDPDEEAYLAGTGDTFISKLDDDGNYLWAKVLLGISTVVQSYAVVVDDEGNVFTTGYCNGAVDFDPSLDEYIIETPTGISYGFISKLDAGGNFVFGIVFESDLDGEGFASGRGIVADTDGNVIVTGYFKNLVDFDGGLGEYTLETTDDAIYVAQYDYAGNFDWAFKIGDGNGNGIAKGTGNTILTTGVFSISLGDDPMDFDPGAGEFLLNTGGAYIQKLGVGGVGVEDILHSASAKISPNPSTNTCHIYFEQVISDATINLYDLTGKMVFHKNITNTSDADLNVAGLIPGMYTVEVNGPGIKISLPFIKQ